MHQNLPFLSRLIRKPCENLYRFAATKNNRTTQSQYKHKATALCKADAHNLSEQSCPSRFTGTSRLCYSRSSYNIPRTVRTKKTLSANLAHILPPQTRTFLPLPTGTSKPFSIQPPIKKRSPTRMARARSCHSGLSTTNFSSLQDGCRKGSFPRSINTRMLWESNFGLDVFCSSKILSQSGKHGEL